MARMTHRAAWTKFVTGEKGKNPSKYGNEKTKEWDSKHEADVGMKLYALERSGKISNLERQVPFILVKGKNKIRPIIYISDFTYIENGKFIVADAKGYRKNAVYILKKKMMYLLLDISIMEL